MTNESTNGELWATINSSFLVGLKIISFLLILTIFIFKGSEQVTPTSEYRALIQGLSTNSKKSKKIKIFNDAFIATSARRLFSASTPLSVISASNVQLQFEGINTTQLSDRSPDSSFLESSLTVNLDSNETQSKCSTQNSRSTLDVGIQTDFTEVSSLKEESFYDQTPLTPELNKVWQN